MGMLTECNVSMQFKDAMLALGEIWSFAPRHSILQEKVYFLRHQGITLAKFRIGRRHKRRLNSKFLNLGSQNYLRLGPWELSLCSLLPNCFCF